MPTVIPCRGVGPVDQMEARFDSVRLLLKGQIGRTENGTPYLDVPADQIEKLAERLRDALGFVNVLQETRQTIEAAKAAGGKS